jgi:hypothetical protein
MRKRWVVCFAILASFGWSAQTNRRELRHRTVGKGAIARSAGHGAMGTVLNSPHQWGRSPSGLAKRTGSSFGKNLIKQPIEMGVAAVHHENLHYQKSNLHGTMPRMKYAVKSTFIVPKTKGRGKTVALGRVSGNMGAGLASQAWMPAAGVGAGVASGGIGLGADVGANVAREFWPKKKPKGRRVVMARRR